MADRFSQRLGFVPAPFHKPDTAPEPVRNHVWNIIEPRLWSGTSNDRYHRLREVFVFLRVPSDRADQDLLRDWVLENSDWYEVYDMLEFVVGRFFADSEIRDVNVALAAEGIPYRFLKRQLVPITTDEEFATITEAMAQPEKYVGVRAHIASATAALARRPVPDVRNCIKESILAVESAAKAATGIDAGAFDPAFKEFERRFGPLHPALAAAVRRLYGYGSDEQGVRHAILDDAKRMDAADARFMLISCSAFANYLIARAEHLP